MANRRQGICRQKGVRRRSCKEFAQNETGDRQAQTDRNRAGTWQEHGRNRAGIGQVRTGQTQVRNRSVRLGKASKR